MAVTWPIQAALLYPTKLPMRTVEYAASGTGNKAVGHIYADH